MAFAQFTLEKVKKELGIQVVEGHQLFPNVPAVTPSEHLRISLERFSQLAMAINTEKSRSEWIIAPILGEVREQANHQIGLFSGTSFTADSTLGLEGTCDFLFSLSPQQYFLSAPVVAVVEAKKEDSTPGLGQCLAIMYGAALFNKQEKNDISYIYGCVSNGAVWKFLKLDGKNGYIDSDTYYLNQLEIILGILVSMTQPQTQPTHITY